MLWDALNREVEDPLGRMLGTNSVEMIWMIGAAYLSYVQKILVDLLLEELSKCIDVNKSRTGDIAGERI
jgi:hypothetical protein